MFVGLPLFLLELGFGQYASEGPITIWKVSPMFQGIGYAMFLMSGLVSIYYNMILAWGLFYLFTSGKSLVLSWFSVESTLPWSSCENWWNTDGIWHKNKNNLRLRISREICTQKLRDIWVRNCSLSDRKKTEIIRYLFIILLGHRFKTNSYSFLSINW